MAGPTNHRKTARTPTAYNNPFIVSGDDGIPQPPPLHTPAKSHPPPKKRKATATSTEPSKVKRPSTFPGKAGGAAEDEDEDETEEDDAESSAAKHVMFDGIDDICTRCPGKRCRCETGACEGASALPSRLKVRLSSRSAQRYTFPKGASTRSSLPPPGATSTDEESSLSSLDADEDSDAETVRIGAHTKGRDNGRDSSQADEGDHSDVPLDLDYGSEIETSDEEGLLGLDGQVEQERKGAGVGHESGSDLGDIYLEYTDFGTGDGGIPGGWSGESDEDTDSENGSSGSDGASSRDQRQPSRSPEEFAELLLMSGGPGQQDESSPVYLASLEHIAQSCAASGAEDEWSSDGTGLMIIEDFGSNRAPSEWEVDSQGRLYLSGGDSSDEDMEDTEDDGGATTDSLDEDDHSGLVAFGIEAEDEDDQDAAFFDLPADSDITAILNDLQASGGSGNDGGQYFLIEGGDSASNELPGPGLALSGSTSGFQSEAHPGPTIQADPFLTNVKLPVMGSFDVSLRVNPGGTPAGRTILDPQTGGDRAPAPSPFSGGKVIRYNRLRKLREQAAAATAVSASGSGEGSPSTSGKPTPNWGDKAELPMPVGGDADEEVEEEAVFDITAFIRGITSKDHTDDECDIPQTPRVGARYDAEDVSHSGVDTDAQLEALSRWNKVPMSAFRRSTMASPHWGGGGRSDPFDANTAHLDGALYHHRGPASLKETLSPLDESSKRLKNLGRLKRRRAEMETLSPVLRPFKYGAGMTKQNRAVRKVEGSQVLSRKERRAMKKKLKEGAPRLTVDEPEEGGTVADGSGRRQEHGDAGGAAGQGLARLSAPSHGFELVSPLFKGALSASQPHANDVPMLELDHSGGA